MADKLPTVQPIAIEDLLIDVHNPRYDPRANQRDAIATIAHDQGVKLINLAEDIVDKGLNPSEVPMVAPSGDSGTFVVLEGNRRVAVLKLLASPSLLASLSLPDSIAKRYKDLQERAKGVVPREIVCAIMPREDANHWIYIRHTGENEGVGVVTWDGVQTHRFRGASPALQAIELVKASNYLDESVKRKLPKIAITNIERILGTPEARRLLGVDVKGQQLSLKDPEEEAIARLAIIVAEVANKNVKVSDLETSVDRVNYARDVATRPLPKPISGTSETPMGASPDSVCSPTAVVPGRRIAPDRKTVIPPRCALTIEQTRINRIYHELQKLDLNKFVNSCAVMFRVFVELSIDHYAQEHEISLKETPKPKSAGSSLAAPKDLPLRKKLLAVAAFMEGTHLCTAAELRGVRTLASNQYHVLSVDSLHAYVHNKDYNPTPVDLKTSWDNMQAFMQRIWGT